MFKFGGKSPSVVELTVSNRTVVRVLVMVVLSMIGLAALRQASHALVLIFIAFFLALAFNAPVSWVSRHMPGRRRGDRAWGTALTSLLLLAVFGGFLASVVPPIVQQSNKFLQNAPQLVADVQNRNSTVGSFVDHYKLRPQIQKFTSDLAARLQDASGSAFSTVSKAGSSLFALLTVLAMTVMMLSEGPHWIGWANRLLPDAKQTHAKTLFSRMYRVVKGYINGQVTLAALASVLIVPMLIILKVPYPFALMFVIFVCGLIPMIGHTIGAIIVTLVALTTSLGAALIVLGYYIFYQQVENYAVQPKIQANSTDMSPLLVFVSVVIGVSFSGLLGGLVAIPIMGCIRVAVLYWLELHDDGTPAVAAKS